MKEKFTINDRVICIKKHIYAPEGTKGTIKEIYPDTNEYVIEWDINVNGWGRAYGIYSGHGETVFEENIKHLKPNKE